MIKVVLEAEGLMCRIGCHCTRGHVALPQPDIKFLAVALAPMRSGFRVVAASVTKATFCVNRRRVAALCVTGWVPGTMRTVKISAARNGTATSVPDALASTGLPMVGDISRRTR